MAEWNGTGTGTEAPVSEGSVFLGIVGALLGAITGAIPWFLASTFTSFFIGWLGFLIGWAAAYGYRTLHGRRSYGLAMTTVVVCSVIALVLADFASNMYILCTDEEWQRTAWFYGISVAELAAVSIVDPDNLGVILPRLAMGLLIGMLGVFSASAHVRKYTNPGEVRAPFQGQQLPNSFSTLNRSWAAPASTGLQLPQQFTVRAPGRNLVFGIVLAVLFGLFFLFSLMVGTLAEEAEAGIFLGILCLCMLALSAVLILQGKNWRLEVDGEWLNGYTLTGRLTRFHVSEIAGVSISTMTGYAKLQGRDGRVLFKYTNIMKNQPLLMQYLAEHNIPLLG